MRSIVALLLLAACAGSSQAPVAPALESAAASSLAQADASAAAHAWLHLVDTGAYAQSWDEAASYFRGAVTREQWVGAVSGVRGPLGEVASRKLASATEATSLPGAPDGRYVVMQYRTAFANKAEAVETVTPMLDGDGRWRVSGYFVR